MNLFEVHAVTCVRIRTTESYWRYVMEVKHPESFKNMSFETAVSQVKETLSEPEVVLRGNVDPSVYLYYRRFHGYLTSVVAKHLNAEGGVQNLGQDIFRTNSRSSGQLNRMITN